ncbi:unnamed protein product [Boreogadus saida]
MRTAAGAGPDGQRGAILGSEACGRHLLDEDLAAQTQAVLTQQDTPSPNVTMGWRVHLDVCWIDQSNQTNTVDVSNVAQLSVIHLGGHAHL